MGKPCTSLFMESLGSLLPALPNAESRKGCTAIVHRVVQIYMKSHVCKLNASSFYHQVHTICKHELCKSINCLIVKGSSCKGCSEDRRGSPKLLSVCVCLSYSTATVTRPSSCARRDVHILCYAINSASHKLCLPAFHGGKRNPHHLLMDGSLRQICCIAQDCKAATRELSL